MSVCDPCLKTELVPKCLTNLIIGTISSLNTAVFVYIRDLTTGKLLRFSEVSSGAGQVTVTGLDTEPDFMPDHSYEMWITLQTAISIEDRETITVTSSLGDVTGTCFQIRFVAVEAE